MEWQPIETAPKDGTRIICRVPSEGYAMPVVLQCVFDNGHWWPDFYDYMGDSILPDLWMPLPKPPCKQST